MKVQSCRMPDDVFVTVVDHEQTLLYTMCPKPNSRINFEKQKKNIRQTKHITMFNFPFEFYSNNDNKHHSHFSADYNT